MILTLEVIGEHAADLGAGGRQVFDAIGGTIGRLSDNDWVLPDPYVSGRHALIRYLNGKFFVEDTSTNGIYLNTPHNRLARAQPHPLQDGDLLFVDTYQIKVTIHGEQTVLHSREVPAQQSVPYSPEDHTASLALAPEDEETEWFGLSEEKPVPRVEAAVQPRIDAMPAA
ncbi:MAG TPA: FHA domain-containing protein, partial [Woeseiaceae bacterium]